MYDRGEIMTEEEQKEIIDWACANFFGFSMIFSFNKGGVIDHNLSPLNKSIPASIWRVKKRIIEREGLQEYIQEPTLKDVLAILLPGGHIPYHRDPNIDNFVHTRFNVFVKLPKRHVKTFYGNDTVDCRERHYTMCRSGLDLHGSEINMEETPRISISFGYLIPREIVDIKYNDPTCIRPIEYSGRKQPSELEVSNLLTNHMTPIIISAVLAGNWFQKRLKDLYDIKGFEDTYFYR